MSWFDQFRRSPTEPTPHNEGNFDSSLTNFTPRAQQVLALARREADRLHHNFLGTEHLLLGLIKLGQGAAVNVLAKMGLNLETVRMEVEKQVGTGPDEKLISYVPYTPRVKKVLTLACKEAKALNHAYVGTEHILLGLLREKDGVAAKVLQNLDVDLEKARQEILCELDPNFSPQQDGKINELTSKEVKPISPGFDTQKNAEPKNLKKDSIDTSKRYDVYCAERNQEIVVYRNALFKGVKALYQLREYEFMSEFMELQQADGQVIFISRTSVVKFCEHGVIPNSETVSPKKIPE